ncbi:MAG TPA: cytochrome c [Terracidiphilus sp.]|nr:cytochrome c [Terracidiphilus sp.]
MLKPILLLFAGIPLTLAPAVLAALPPGQAPAAVAASAKNPVKPTAESQTKAKNLYKIDCAVCHGDNGNGKTDLATSMSLTLDDWTDPKALADKQDGELFNMIRTGKDKMPPEDPARAKDDDVWNLVIYIRSFSKAGTTAASTASK